jgi:hypothetical protein
MQISIVHLTMAYSSRLLFLYIPTLASAKTLDLTSCTISSAYFGLLQVPTQRDTQSQHALRDDLTKRAPNVGYRE